MVRASLTTSLNIKERRTNSKEIVRSVKEYLDHNKWNEEVTGEFHVVVCSASGGSGNLIATSLLTDMRRRSIPVVAVIVGDSSNGLAANNTAKVIATIDAITKRIIKKSIPVFYFNNHAAKSKGNAAKEKEVNELIFNSLSVLSLFLSGDNEDIDTRDMANFLSPDNYESFTVEPALMNISIVVGEAVEPNDEHTYLLGRTLTTEGQDCDIGIPLLHHKYGKVIVSDAVVSAREIAPVHMLLVANFMAAEHKRLLATVAEYDALAKSVSAMDLAGIGDASDDGVVF